MKTKTVIIGLVADRIDMLVCQGDRVVAGRRIDMPVACDAAEWCKAVKGAAKAVRAASIEMNAAGASAYVLYRSPTECAEYASLRFRSSSEARQAAILSCADALSCPIDLADCQAHVVGRDSSGAQPQTHVVVAGDHDDSVSLIASMVEDAELKFISATPMDAAIMSRVVSHCLRCKCEPTGYLYLGEHRSFFVVAGGGTLMFGRAISLGANALVTCLTRPIRTSRAAEPIELGYQTAKEIIYRHGIPARSQIVHDSLELNGGQIIPLLQPLLQRYIVELRQSLRFGVPEGHRQSVNLVISGPGGAIPNFATVIGHELGLETSVDERSAAYDWQAAESSGSELADATEDRTVLDRLGLQPHHVARFRQASLMKRWLWAGAAAAIALIAVDAVRYRAQVADLRRAAETAAAHSAALQTIQGSGEKLLASVAAMNKLEKSIADHTSTQVNLRACLQELSNLTPPSIRLTRISFRQEGAASVGSVGGYALEHASGAGKTQLEPFISQLRSSPLFEKVVLANVQSSVLGDVTGKRFEANFISVPAPVVMQDDALTSAVPAEEGHTP